MDFDQLNAFLEVARLKSFSRAAIQVFRTQPAISAQIRSLEEEVGARLFDRSGGKVALTDPGRLFHGFAERLLLMRKEAIQAVGDLNRKPSGELLIAANEGSCLHVLPEVFAEFKRQHEAVQVRIRRGEHNDIMEQVLENRADFGVVSLPVRDQRLKVVPLHRDQILIAVAPGHALALAGEPPTPEALLRCPLLLPRAGQTREAIEAWLNPDGAALPISMELDSTELLKGFAAAGLGVAFVARTLAAAEARAGELVLLEMNGKKIFRDLGLIFRRDRVLSLAALAFIDIAVRRAASAPHPA
ncbi:MAG TPA: LysR family transcriptional regulator [Terriglobales bacterium]|jgi:DNA-binding transcriptional LysR family regulator